MDAAVHRLSGLFPSSCSPKHRGRARYRLRSLLQLLHRTVRTNESRLKQLETIVDRFTFVHNAESLPPKDTTIDLCTEYCCDLKTVPAARHMAAVNDTSSAPADASIVLHPTASVSAGTPPHVTQMRELAVNVDSSSRSVLFMQPPSNLPPVTKKACTPLMPIPSSPQSIGLDAPSPDANDRVSALTAVIAALSLQLKSDKDNAIKATRDLQQSADAVGTCFTQIRTTVDAHMTSINAQATSLTATTTELHRLAAKSMKQEKLIAQNLTSLKALRNKIGLMRADITASCSAPEGEVDLQDLCANISADDEVILLNCIAVAKEACTRAPFANSVRIFGYKATADLEKELPKLIKITQFDARKFRVSRFGRVDEFGYQGVEVVFDEPVARRFANTYWNYKMQNDLALGVQLKIVTSKPQLLRDGMSCMYKVHAGLSAKFHFLSTRVLGGNCLRIGRDFFSAYDFLFPAIVLTDGRVIPIQRILDHRDFELIKQDLPNCPRPDLQLKTFYS